METDFQKILKVTRWAKRDAMPPNIVSISKLGNTVIGLVAMLMSLEVIEVMFSGRKAEIVRAWYHTVYEMRLVK